MMRLGLLSLVVTACSSSSPPPVGNAGSSATEPSGVVQDTRTPYLKRRETACTAIGKRLVSCAVQDASGSLAAGKITKTQYDKDTSTDVTARLADEWQTKCYKKGTTRQLRVLEVCEREEQECEPLLECLQHLNDPE